MEDWIEVEPIAATQEGGGQAGGRIVGQGAYGCIFTPPLRCLNKRKGTGRRNKLGKLTEKGDIANEIGAAVIFRPFAKEASKYFILPEIDTLCKPDLVTAKKTEKDLKDCEPLMKRGPDEMLHYEVEYGGKTLRDKLKEVDISKGDTFWRLAEDLLEAGAYMVLHAFVHNDFHSNNVLVNQNFHPRLIDFGRSYIGPKFDEETVEMLAAEYEASIGHIPPESTTQDGIVGGIPLQKIYVDIRTEKEALANVQRILGISRDAQMAEFKRFWENSKAAKARDWVAFWRMYWPGVDAWAVGHNIMKILSKLLISKQFADSAAWKTRGPILKGVLRGLLRMSPRDRLDCVEALAMLDPANPVLQTPAGTSWLSKRQALRAKLRS